MIQSKGFLQVADLKSGFVQFDESPDKICIIIQVAWIDHFTIPVATIQARSRFLEVLEDKANRTSGCIHIGLITKSLVGLGHGGNHQPIPGGEYLVILERMNPSFPRHKETFSCLFQKVFQLGNLHILLRGEIL